jgi:hypothetical protein
VGSGGNTGAAIPAGRVDDMRGTDVTGVVAAVGDAEGASRPGSRSAISFTATADSRVDDRPYDSRSWTMVA